MDRAGETITNLADLLALHREAIAASTAQQAQQLPGTRYQNLPLDDLRGVILRGIDALITDIRGHSNEQSHQFAFDIGRQFLAADFDIGEVIEAYLLFKEVVFALIWQSFEHGSAEAYQAIQELDIHGRHSVATFGHLYAEMMQRQVREQQLQRDLMLDATEAASHSVEPAEAMGQLASWLITAVSAQACDIYMLSPEIVSGPERIETRHLTAVGRDTSGKRELDSEFLPVVRDVLNRRQPRVIQIAENGVLLSPEGDGPPGIKRVLILPLESDSLVFGVALLWSDGKQPDFAPQTVELVLGLARAVTAAIAKSRLYRITRQHLAESQSLQRVTTALLEKLSLKDVLKIVCVEAQALTDAKGSTIFLVEQEDWLWNALSIGEATFTVERLPIKGSFSGMAVQRGEVCLSNDPAAQAHHFAVPIQATAVLAVPLRAKGAIIGVLDVVNKPNGFDDDDVRIMNLIADQAAIAIENARLSQQLEQLAVVEERQRLARDLHDSVTQTLYSVTLYADAAIWSLNAGNTSVAADHIREVQSGSREALREMRLLIFELHPPELEAEGLVAVLQARLQAVEARAAFKANFRIEGERRLPLAVEEALYRIAQEALNNIFKHANTHQVTVTLRFSDDDVSLEVSDDGVGFDPAMRPSQGGLGLRGMEERVRKLGGTLQVNSAPGKGTQVRVTVKTRNVP